MYESHKSSSHKSRQEIEKDVSEHKFFENQNVLPNQNIGAFSIPSFIPMFPLMDLDEYANQQQQDNIHMINKSGDVALENNESFNEIEVHSSVDIIKEEGLIINRVQSEKFHPLELYWENITVTAKIKERRFRHLPCCINISKKVILDKCTGIARPGTFTAILGPSGCGKTTLLNFLSGRMLSENLKITGKMKINGVDVPNIDAVSNQIAYVMQDDILLGTFTPREAFYFTASMRLAVSDEEKWKKVDQLLKDLGLQECQHTKIGTNLIRGVSGGERKRTSIGVELLTNPSIIFLDEPTTGLDSATSFHVINILKNLAKAGRTIISTIHQPSSEIFGTFDKLLLMVQGNIIYQGKADEAIDHFAKFGLNAPVFSNPSTFFMKCMNPEGLLVENMQKTKNYDIPFNQEIKYQFKERLAKMIDFYKESPNYKEITPTVTMDLPHDKSLNTVSWFTQLKLLTKRGFVNEFRNPMELRTRFFTTIVMAFVCVIVFEGLGDYKSGIQNRNGCLFFIIMGCSFNPIMDSIMTFSSEKPLFLREVLNRTYSVSAYYWGKTSSEFPFHVLYPIIQISIIYFLVGLSLDPYDKFFVLIGIGIVTYFSGVSYGLFLSIVLPKPELAMSLIPVIIIPFMLFGGFFVNQNNIPYFFYPLQYLSMFFYGFQAAAQNEFQNTVIYCDPSKKTICDPLKDANYGEGINESVLILLLIGVGLRILTYFIMNKVSAPKRPKLQSYNRIELNQIMPKK